MSKKKISWPVFIVITAFAVIITFQITFLAVTQHYREELSKISVVEEKETWENKLEYINELTQKYFLNEISKEELEDILPKAYMAALDDKYTYYMTKEEYEAFVSNNNADMQGIGINVVYNSEKKVIEVVGVVNGSPAHENGVEVGDLIYEAEGKNLAEIGYNEAMNVLLGKAGTVANFSVKRQTEEGEVTLAFSIERGFIVEETVSYRLQGENVGIIRIEEFDLKTPEQFENALNALLELGADRFVFDVRYNPGGDLESISKILDILLPEGPIIRIVDKYGEETVINSDANSFDYPMAVVVNKSTASAAELFTAALKDYEKAVVVGESTYGKGVMQTVFGLADGSALCMTTQTYCPPFSDSYNGVGVIPDIEVSLPEDIKKVSIYKMTYEQDVQIKTAVELLTE